MKMRRLLMMAAGIVLLLILSFKFREEIPRTWDLKLIKKFHLPPPDTSVIVTYAPEEYYNKLPDHVITKTFPVYLREYERPGYLDSLRQLEPEVVFDPVKLKTPEDWVKAGKEVFNWPVAYTPYNGKESKYTKKDFNPARTKLTSDGAYGFNRYVINEKGKILIGSLSCASCHTHVLESGESIAGGQGNIISSDGLTSAVQSGRIPFPIIQQGTRQLSYAPWASDFRSQPENVNEFVNYFNSMTPGIVDRQGVAFLYPVSVPSLIGIKDIRYLDHTGLMRHDGPGDMMRYAAFNQGMDMLTSYNGYIPGGKDKGSELPSASEWNHPFGYVGKKYSDEQLYALTLYIYSLKPPKNPNKFPKAVTERGEVVFKIAGCVSCHTPPLYTNNKLTPANGFEPTPSHYKKYDIFNVSVETDSVSTLYSRRGTGYYKVPSLRGVWFRNAFFHNGNLASLDEILDPARLRSDYVPKGYLLPGKKTMAVKGHSFGLDLSDKDKQALIAFMKTL